MGLHLVALAKFHILSSSRSFTPLVAGLVCPFVLKLSFRLSVVRQVYGDAIEASMLFLFQLRQIAFEGDPQPVEDSNVTDRWQRALRLVCQRITHVRRSPVRQSDEDSFHTLTILSL